MRTGPRLFLLTVLLFCTPAFASADKDAVSKLLTGQVSAWNQKDLAGYMSGYWKSPELTFFSGGTVTRGWRETFDRYKERYQTAGKEMGTLAFEDLSVETLGGKAAVARGTWQLTKADGEKVRGLFTLILRKLPEGWRIVHDHTSL